MSVFLRNLLVAVLLTNAGPAPAESVRELDRAELRKIVTSGGIISLKKAVAAVAASTAAEPIEARAFLADAVVYRMVLKRPDGTLFSVILDAGTGRSVSASSPLGRQVSRAAEARSDAGAAPGKKAVDGRAHGEANKGDSGGGNAGGAGGGGGNGGGSGNGGGKGGGGGRP